MYRIIALFVLLVIEYTHLYGQMDNYSIINHRPASPTAYEFIKYTEVPVSEYTGLPNISVPIHTISVDEVKIPIALTYHAQGIRVSQEASWVGLGWDFQVGSVIQTVQDRDDYGTYGGAITKLRPDWFYSNGDGQPRMLPMRYKRPSTSNGDGWTTPFPILSPSLSSLQQGFAVATDSYIPVNGDFSVQQWDLLNERWYDSEPDMFNATFPGGNIKFIIDFGNSSILKVLNKKGYKVDKTTNGFAIINPEGTKFLFELKSPSTLYTYSNNIDGYSSPTPYEASTNIFFLTQIVTRNKENVNFEYSSSSGFNNSYPQYSDKLVALTNQTDNTVSVPWGVTNFADVTNDGSYAPWQGVLGSHSVMNEKYYYLKSISFPGGKMEFQVSGRTDISGAKKLDKVFLRTSGNQLVKQWNLNYTYFDASGVNGNGYLNTNGASLTSETRTSLRLKLNSVQEVNGGSFSFTYNSVPLPKKNSFAQDYWGFYNGALSNTSLAPNPTTLGYTGFVSNSNNRNADISYIKAGMLEELFYPTGGKVQFEYELNQLDKIQMQGFPSSTPQYINGSGVRIKSIKHYENSETLSKKVTYSYEGGKLINPKQLFRELPYFQYMGLSGGNSTIGIRSYTYKELSCNGVFSSNPLGSINGVGYNKVIRQEEGVGNVTLGKTVSFFHNTPDIHNPTIANRVLYCALPTVKLRGVENGSLQSVKVYDVSDRLIRNSEHTYDLSGSDLTYGARVFPYGAKLYFINNQGVPEKYTIRQHLVGYYPIHDFSSLLNKIVTTEYDDNNQPMVSESGWQYDVLDRLSNNYSKGADGESIIHTYTYPGTGPLVAANRMMEPLSINKNKRTALNNTISSSRQSYEYTSVGSRYLLNSITKEAVIKPGGVPSISEVTVFDPVTGKPLEYVEKQGTISSGIVSRTSHIWDYASLYITAEVKNASINQIAYSSFETAVSGNWSYGTTILKDASAPTGEKVYSLNSGSVVRNSLAPGTYTVSYWKKGGTVSVNGQGGQLIKVIGDWSYYEHKVTLSTAGAVSITGSGAFLDEVRLHPAEAFMNTYTYKQLIGMTTSTDPAGVSTYYEYDGSGRLFLVKDQQRRIVKKICYSYSGQVEECPGTTVYSNAIRQETFTRNNCGTGYVGSNVTYTVPAGTYTSLINVEDANQKALDDIAANGQAYANANGTCSPSPVLHTLRGFNAAGTDFTVAFTNTSTSFTTYYFFNDGTWNQSIGQLAEGVYDITITPQTSSFLFDWNVGGYTLMGYNIYTRSSVSVNGTLDITVYSSY